MIDLPMRIRQLCAVSRLAPTDIFKLADINPARGVEYLSRRTTLSPAEMARLTTVLKERES